MGDKRKYVVFTLEGSTMHEIPEHVPARMAPVYRSWKRWKNSQTPTSTDPAYIATQVRLRRWEKQRTQERLERFKRLKRT